MTCCFHFDDPVLPCAYENLIQVCSGVLMCSSIPIKRAYGTLFSLNFGPAVPASHLFHDHSSKKWSLAKECVLMLKMSSVMRKPGFCIMRFGLVWLLFNVLVNNFSVILGWMEPLLPGYLPVLWRA